MSDRDRSSPSLTDTPLKTYIGRHDDDYPLINGNGECFLSSSPEGPRARSARARSGRLSARHALGAGRAAGRAACPHARARTGSAAAHSACPLALLTGCGSPHTISFAALKLPPFDRPAPLWPLPEKRKLTYSSR